MTLTFVISVLIACIETPLGGDMFSDGKVSFIVNLRDDEALFAKPRSLDSIYPFGSDIQRIHGHAPDTPLCL